MKCPACQEVSTFSHPYQLLYSAPVGFEDGEIVIDYNNAKDHDAEENEDTCTCDKCDSEVFLDDIEVVEAEEAQ